MNSSKAIIIAAALVLFAGAYVYTAYDGNAPEALATADGAAEEPAPDATPAPEAPAEDAPVAELPASVTTPDGHPAIEPAPADTPAPVAPLDADSATVNGVEIGSAAVEDELERLLVAPAAHSGMNADRRSELRAKALDELVIRELAYQDAKARGVAATPRELRAGVARIRARYNTAEAFAEALAADRITEKGLEARVEREIVLDKYAHAQIDDKAKVTEAEVRQQYEANKRRFVQPESLRVLAILVEVKDGDEAAAKARIDEAYAELQKGARFDEVAYKYSEDDYAVMGGDYGTIHRGRLSPELEAVVFAAKENEVVAPFRSSLGWNIVRVSDRKPEHQLAFQDVRDKIRKALTDARLKARRAELLERLRAGATIEYARTQAGAAPGAAEVR